jgi:hypothetical protein
MFLEVGKSQEHSTSGLLGMSSPPHVRRQKGKRAVEQEGLNMLLTTRLLLE